ncbi:hypothetical protein [Saccharopolyspora spinosa]|uniref:hypothetical protein n=1 Tax=Saccharopolyspora spinosa TaxID=60894 RepID=UPI00117ADDB4|nr:hypothetical protein [Saccharopolyspora spinosa]
MLTPSPSSSPGAYGRIRLARQRKRWNFGAANARPFVLSGLSERRKRQPDRRNSRVGCTNNPFDIPDDVRWIVWLAGLGGQALELVLADTGYDVRNIGQTAAG